MKTESLITRYFPAQRKWAGKWIWPKDCGKEANRFYFFRKEFTLDNIQPGYKFYISDPFNRKILEAINRGGRRMVRSAISK